MRATRYDTFWSFSLASETVHQHTQWDQRAFAAPTLEGPSTLIYEFDLGGTPQKTNRTWVCHFLDLNL